MFPEALQHIDQQIFILINDKWSNHFFDIIMPPVRDKYFWVPLYVLIAILITIQFKWKGVILIAVILANFGVSDQLSSAIVKPAVGRIRPCNDPAFSDAVHLRIDACGVGKSFTSSHATNTFALAMMLTLLFRKRSRIIAPAVFLWAAVVSYAQIYVGVHYPFDIIGGMLIGISITIIIYTLANKYVFKKWLPEL